MFPFLELIVEELLRLDVRYKSREPIVDDQFCKIYTLTRIKTSKFGN